LIVDAIAQGLCRSETDFDFVNLFSEGDVEASLSPDSRAAGVQSLCQQQQGQFTLDTAKAILQDHQGAIKSQSASQRLIDDPPQPGVDRNGAHDPLAQPRPTDS
jgi:hypothetical protein